MNVEKPRKTASGVIHHVSRRLVDPNPRDTSVTGITCIQPPHVRDSRLVIGDSRHQSPITHHEPLI
jgi:hypothetical protein